MLVSRCRELLNTQSAFSPVALWRQMRRGWGFIGVSQGMRKAGSGSLVERHWPSAVAALSLRLLELA